MDNHTKLRVNPDVVLREEFDDWAILFDPNTGKAYGINPVSVIIWRRLDGTRTVDDLLTELHKHCDNVPDSASEELMAFLQQLVDKGFAGANHGNG
jgi:SynChlorMet cassette protein ScmD